MKEYRLKITSQNPVIITEDQFNTFKDKDGLMFGRTNQMVSLGGVGFNLKDVRGWETIEVDEFPRGWEPEQTELHQEGIRKLRLVMAAFNSRKAEKLSLSERAEVEGILKDHKTRKASEEYQRRKLFDKLHYDVPYLTPQKREEAYRHWSKSAEAAKIVVEKQVQEIKEVFNAEEITPEAQLSTGEAEVQRVKQILQEMNPDDEFISPF